MDEWMDVKADLRIAYGNEIHTSIFSQNFVKQPNVLWEWGKGPFEIFS